MGQTMEMNKMSKEKGVFRSALDSLIEARMRQANRHIAEYRAVYEADQRIVRFAKD